MIKGYCDDRFLKIKSILSNQINSGYELGCSVAVEYKGEEVINLYGGYTDETKTNLWKKNTLVNVCLLYTSPSPRDLSTSRMPSSA